MAFYDKFPYTNFQELNLDWIIKKVKELDYKVGVDLENTIGRYLDKHLSSIVAGAMYAEDDEMIVLTIPIQTGGENHVYNVAQQTIYVKEDDE